MHLKLDPSGPIDSGDVARDLGQESADIVVLSAADNELAVFAAARALLPVDFPSAQFTNFLALGHPMSVDAYVERTLTAAKIVVLRALGGEGYWPHGVASLRADALRRGSIFACLPGELQWDETLSARGTVARPDAHALWRYCAEGGVENARLALLYAAHLIGRAGRPEAARAMPAAGFWPAEPASQDGSIAVVLFYRALVAGGATAPIAALVCRA